MKQIKFLTAFLAIFSMTALTQSCELFEEDDPCETVSCENGGTCVDGACDCPEGYSGTNCQTFDATQVQKLLDSGNHTPLELYNGGISLDDLYGKTYQGGLIFFVNTNPAMYPNFSGDGMVCTAVDYGNFDAWGCYGVTGATGSEVGDGPSNTQAILNTNNNGNCSATPASTIICNDLVLEGYDDWFLPSIGEVQLIYDNLHVNGHSNFLGNIRRYQSSTEIDADHFKLKPFYQDTIYNMIKISGDDIRPTRIF